MDFKLSGEQRLMRESAARLLGRYADRGDAESYWRALWADFAQAGWLGLAAPHALGGLAADGPSLNVFMGELGRAGVATPFVECALTSINLLSRWGTAQQQAGLVSDIISGRRVVVPVLGAEAYSAEPPRAMPRGRRTGAGWSLSGAVSLVPAGGWADLLLISAAVDGRPRFFLAPADADGLTVRRSGHLDGRMAADISFSDLRLPEEAVLGAHDAPTLDEIRSVARQSIAALCAEAVGVMSFLLDTTVQYVEQRQQFGRKLSANQAVEHRIARMAIAVDEAQAISVLASLAAGAAEASQDTVLSSAKAKIGQAGRFVGQSAIQLHGGMGMSEALPIGRYFKRLIAFETAFGSTAWHLRRIATHIERADGEGYGPAYAASPVALS
jgi:alkylation response protein AidB-like acyl-CoA dehydrogenase